MSTELAEQEIGTEDKNSAPAFSIEFCLSMIKAIVSQRGETPFSRKEAAVILGKSESNVGPKLGACGQYGIIANDRGRGYKITSLYQRIEMPISIEDRTSALLTLINNPSVYKRLINDYNGKVLPANEEMFTNLLVSAYGLIRTSAERAAKIFLENGRFVAIIDGNNRLRFLLPVNIGTTTPASNNNESSNEQPTSNPVPPKLDGMIEILIPLKNGKKAYLHIPEEYTEEELNRIAKFVDALK